MSKCVIDKISEKFSNIVIEFDDEESLVDYIKDFKEDIEDVLQLIKKALELINSKYNKKIKLHFYVYADSEIDDKYLSIVVLPKVKEDINIFHDLEYEFYSNDTIFKEMFKKSFWLSLKIGDVDSHIR